ncbi:DapH/DapD/GlmU-related protein [Gordonia insulae]|uniref:Maltose O-acetyltransferase n=1 Tax=Gordonia insulae TaxID=2420509 RepID=A0A3G8JU84_9ACTN|nr:DapH/DapD/GlmU-related protein [Gordonia insulae]AZG48092.1 Maltose O-acetyltransferase [Gordonia insulae]
MTHPDMNLGRFGGAGYNKGRSVFIQAVWMAVRTPLSLWWVPSGIRVRVLRAFGAEIGTGVLIRHDVRIHWPWKLSVGNNSWIGEGAWILNLEPVRIGHDCCVSQQALLCSGSHQRRSSSFEFDNAPISIGDRVWIATRSIVLRGVTIGDNAVVGANTVVSRDVEPSGLVLPVAAERQSAAS